MSETTSDNQTLKLKSYLIRLLGMREYSRAELKTKALCHKAGFGEGLVELVLDELVAQDWQNDKRFVESFIRSKALRGQGLRKIQSALREKGIDKALILEVLHDDENEAPDFFQSALSLYQRKYPNPPQTPAERAKRMRFLAARGFDFEVIRAVMKH